MTRHLNAAITTVRGAILVVACLDGADPWLWLFLFAAAGPAVRAIHANAVEARSDRAYQRHRDAMRRATGHPSFGEDE